MPGASIKMAIAAAVVRSAVMQHCNNAWLIGSGVAPVDLVRIRPRRNHILQQGRGGAKGLRLAQKIWRLRDLRISLTLSHARNINIRPLEGPPVAGAAFLFPQSAEAPVHCGRAQQSTRPTLHSHYCLYLVAAGGARRTSTHGSDFFFSASGSPLNCRLVGAINGSVRFSFLVWCAKNFARPVYPVDRSERKRPASSES